MTTAIDSIPTITTLPRLYQSSTLQYIYELAHQPAVECAPWSDTIKEEGKKVQKQKEALEKRLKESLVNSEDATATDTPTVANVQRTTKNTIHCLNCSLIHDIVPLSKEEDQLMRVSGLQFSGKAYFCDALCYLRWKDEQARHPDGTHPYGYASMPAYNVFHYAALQDAHPEWRRIPWLDDALELACHSDSLDMIQLPGEDDRRHTSDKRYAYPPPGIKEDGEQPIEHEYD